METSCCNCGQTDEHLTLVELDSHQFDLCPCCLDNFLDKYIDIEESE